MYHHSGYSGYSAYIAINYHNWLYGNKILYSHYVVISGYCGYDVYSVFMGEESKKMVQVRISLPEEYRRLFKAYCTETGTDMSKKITEYIESELVKAGKIK